MVNPEYLNGLFIGASIVTVCWIITRVGMSVKLHRNYHKNVQKFPNVVRLVESKTCKGRHSWHSVVLAFTKIPVQEYPVCVGCGFVSGTEFQLNAAAISAISEDKKNQEVQEAQDQTITARIHEELTLAESEFTKDIIDQLESAVKTSDLKAAKKILSQVFSNALVVQTKITKKLKRELNEKHGSN